VSPVKGPARCGRITVEPEAIPPWIQFNMPDLTAYRKLEIHMDDNRVNRALRDWSVHHKSQLYR